MFQDRTKGKSFARDLMPNTHHGGIVGRYFFRFSLGILSVLLLVWLWQKCYDPRILPIYHVKIVGSFSPVSQAMLQQSILPFVQKGLLQIDKKALQAHLLKWSWISTAMVHRVWPDTLVIRLLTRVPIAKIRFEDNQLISQHNRNWPPTDQDPIRMHSKPENQAANGVTTHMALLDSEAHIFQSETGWTEPNLPLLIGPPEKAKDLLSTFQQLKALLEPLACNIQSLALDTEQRWQLQLSHGTRLLLGHLDPVGQLRRLLDIYPKILQDQTGELVSLDLRYPNKMAILMRETPI